MTQDCSALNLQLCRREALLRAALALSSGRRSTRRVQKINETNTEKPPQPGDHLVFLTGPKKGQPARVEDLGAAVHSSKPIRPIERASCATARRSISCSWCGSATTATTANSQAFGRRRGRLFRHMHASALSGKPMVERKKSHGLLLPWFDLRSEEQREGDFRTGAAAAGRPAPEKRESAFDRGRRI